MTDHTCKICEGKLKNGLFVEHRICSDCGAEFYSGPSLDVSYGHVDRNAVLANLADALSELGMGQRVLDVGCGHGKFVHLLRQRGLDAYGIDVSLACVAAARQKYGNYFQLASIFEASEEYDSVCYVDTIEHIEEFAREVDGAISKLRAGGRLLLYYPCSNGLFYALVKLLALMGFKKTLFGFWAVANNYPHRVIFSDKSLAIFCEARELSYSMYSFSLRGTLRDKTRSPQTNHSFREALRSIARSPFFSPWRLAVIS